MKKRSSNFVAFFLILVMITGCGGKNTAAPDKSDSAKETLTQETTEKQKTSDSKEAAAAQDNKSEVSVYRLVSEYDKSSDTNNTLLEHQYGKKPKEAETVYQFEAGTITDSARIVDISGDKILIKQGPGLYVLNLGSKELTLLNEGAVDSDVDGMIKYTDQNNKEFSIEDWSNAPEPKATGNEVVSYATEVPENIDVDFPDFAEIQNSAREGKVREAYNAGYTIEKNGDMYSHATGKYVTNINLPKAVVGNTFNCYDTIFFIDNNQINLYYFGESIFDKKLPEGTWKVVSANLDYDFKDDDLVSEVTADVMRKSLVEINVLLFNDEDDSLWVCHGEEMERIAVGVLDFFGTNDSVFYIDNDHIPYVGSFITDYFAKVGEPVIGVSHFKDNLGFIVDDERGEKVNGLLIWPFR